MLTIQRPNAPFEPTKVGSPDASTSSASVWQRLFPFILVFCVACVLLFTNLGSYPLFNPDESLYAEPAREMLDTSEYITTLLNYVVRYTKPPLVIWAMAGCYQLFGVNEFAARFVGAACGAILVAALYWFSERYVSRRAAAIAGICLATSPLFIGTGREAITDMPLSLFIAGALMAFYHGFQQRIGWWRWLAYALLGLAVMTKGPVGLILPVGIMAGYHVLRGDWKEAWNYYTPLPGLLLVAAIAVPWFATEIYVTRGAYYQEFLVRENFQRFTSVVDHKGAWWYHIAAVAGGFLPWTIFAPQALFSAVRQKPRAAASAVPLFCSIWFLSVLVFFSVSVSKLLPYTLPAFPALALLVGIYLDTAIRAGKRLPILIPLAVLAVVCSAALYVVPGALTRMRELPPQLPHIIQSSLTALLDCSIAAGVVAALARTRWAIALFALLVFACFALYGSRTLDVISSEWEGPVPAFAQFASLSGEPIVVWHMRKPSITFYARRQVIIPLDEDSLRRVVDQEPRAYIIGKTADMPLLCSLSGCRVLVKQGRFVLLAKQPTAVH